jgi:intermediate cleaving peptidase 55
VAHIASLLPKILDGAKTVYTDVPASMNPEASFDRFFAATAISSGTYYSTNEDASGVAGLLASLKKKGASIKPVGSVLAGLRVLKSEAEVRAMRYAGQQAGRAHTSAMRRSWRDEKKLAVFLRSEMMAERCEDEAYIPVVAGGRVSG